MGQLTKPSVIRQYMKQYKFFFKKDLGQNFLIDEHIAERIVDALNLTGAETVLEIGPGIGALTELLLEEARRVVAIEIDTYSVRMLRDIFAEEEKLELVQADILKTDLNELLSSDLKNGTPISAISNLPYYITSPVIMKLLEEKLPFASIVTMMQKEVAQRLSAEISTKDYSVFTIALQYYAQAEILFDVPRTVFMPQPTVDSSVVRITPRTEPIISVLDEAMFFRTVKAAFAMRRKTILNCLSAGFTLPKDTVREILTQVGIEENTRAERISIEQFGRLSDLFFQMKQV
jgi:16S rRNA (adenine1518-N6/adenine1519-N6)-dimethyltransferase